MPRNIPVGNGSFLINFDESYFIRDFYWPFVGAYNHSNGKPWRAGVWTDQGMSWFDNPDWKRTLNYEKDHLVTDVWLRNEKIGLELHCNDCIDFHLNLFMRKITVKNLWDRNRLVKVFHHHDFYMCENNVGDCGSFDPKTGSVVHYKGNNFFLVSSSDGRKFGVDQWALGTKVLRGAEGTWRDAEDGVLGGNPIAHGSIDSTVGLDMPLTPNGSASGYYWIAAGHDYNTVADMDRVVRDRSPQRILDRTRGYWKLWVNKEEFNFDVLPEKVTDIFKRSLLLVRTQIDNGGAIIAANDTDITHFNGDTYSYCWTRDGALVAASMTAAGYQDVSKRFFEYCGRIIGRDGYFMHKYNPDGSLASSWHPSWAEHKERLPIQQDETALVIWSIWRFFDRFREVETIKGFYRALIVNAGEWMVKYRNPVTKLPLPSYDLWEERWGVHTWSVCATIAGLRAAAQFSKAFDDPYHRQMFGLAADEMLAALKRHLWIPDRGYFARMATETGDTARPYELDMTVESANCALFLFDILPPESHEVAGMMKAIRETLWVKTDVGGLARYEKDYYHSVSQDYGRIQGNPWFITTLWLATYQISIAKNDNDLAEAMKLIEWVANHALPSGVLAEQVHPLTNEPMSVSPLTWSHAGFIMTVLDFMQKKRKLSRGTGKRVTLHKESRFDPKEESFQWDK